MKNKNNGLFALFAFGAIGALWRRWFGGGFGKAGKITRFFKYAVLILVCLTMLYVKTRCFIFWEKLKHTRKLFPLRFIGRKDTAIISLCGTPEKMRDVSDGLIGRYGGFMAKGIITASKAMLQDWCCVTVALLVWLPFVLATLCFACPVYLLRFLTSSRERWKTRRTRRSF